MAPAISLGEYSVASPRSSPLRSLRRQGCCCALPGRAGGRAGRRGRQARGSVWRSPVESLPRTPPTAKSSSRQRQRVPSVVSRPSRRGFERGSRLPKSGTQAQLAAAVSAPSIAVAGAGARQYEAALELSPSPAGFAVVTNIGVAPSDPTTLSGTGDQFTAGSAAGDLLAWPAV